MKKKKKKAAAALGFPSLFSSSSSSHRRTIMGLPTATITTPPTQPPPTSSGPDDYIEPELLAKLDALPGSWVAENSLTLENGVDLETYANSRGITSGASDTFLSSPVALEEEPSSWPLSPEASAESRGSQFAPSALPDTADPFVRKQDVVAKMLRTARDYACGNRGPPGQPTPGACTKWDLNASLSDPTHEPAQLGLTYVWGSRNPTPRNRPRSDAGDFCCADKNSQTCFATRGLDCSGMMILVARAAGITLGPGESSKTLKDPETWNRQMPASWGLKMTLLPSSSAIEPGDIVGFNGHVGIAESATRFISATGGSVAQDKVSVEACRRNIVSPRGPRSMPTADFGKPVTAILRMSRVDGKCYDYVCHEEFSCPQSDPSGPCGCRQKGQQCGCSSPFCLVPPMGDGFLEPFCERCVPTGNPPGITGSLDVRCSCPKSPCPWCPNSSFYACITCVTGQFINGQYVPDVDILRCSDGKHVTDTVRTVYCQ